MRFRHFTGSGQALDDEISEWVESGAEVRFMSQSLLADGTIIVCFIYQESFAAQEHRLSAERGQREVMPAKLRPDPIHVESEGVE